MPQILRDNNDTAMAIVHGLVDVIKHPACVISPTMGFVTWNKAARQLKSYGVNLKSRPLSDGETITCRERLYRVFCQKLNHQTDFVLYELHDVSTLTTRLKYAGQMLDKALSGDN